MNMSASNITSISLQQAQIATYSDVASVVVLIYDWFLTVDLELTFVWKAPWNLGTLLYILARYPTFVDALLQLYRMFLVSGGIAEVLMMVCVWAIWGKARKVAIFLIILVIGAAATSTIGLHSDQNSETFIAPGILPPNIPGCQVIPQGTHNMIYMDFLAVVILESVLLSLVLFKAVQYSRDYPSTFISECFRHGLLYYVVLDAVSITNLAITSRGGSLGSFSASIQGSLHAILSARMLLHLRYSARRLGGGGNTTILPSDEEIIFEPGPGDLTDTSDRSGAAII
ncbi:hypothetical protein BD779DRAFT_1672798 [Infundibulicybe gibba]|nr:hypothetical protein BD779DRAFT_1672798 [Infundibulicybe gibba]